MEEDSSISNSNSNSNSLALALIEFKNNEEQKQETQEPIPLQINFPLRRSPRFFSHFHNVAFFNPNSPLNLSFQQFSFIQTPHFLRNVSNGRRVRHSAPFLKQDQTQLERLTVRLSSHVAGTQNSYLIDALPEKRKLGQKTSVELEAKPLLSWHSDNGNTAPLQTGLKKCHSESGNLLCVNEELSLEQKFDCCGVCDQERPCKRVKLQNSDSAVGVMNCKMGCSVTELPEIVDKPSPNSSKKSAKKGSPRVKVCSLIGGPVPADEANERWRWRYELKSQKAKSRRSNLNDDDEDKIVWNVECHYTQAKVNGSIFSLGDSVYIKGEEEKKHVGRIVEFFRTTDGEDYFRVQWFYRAEDTVMKQEAGFHDKKRLFYSSVMNDNPIDCIISKVNVVQKSPMAGPKSSVRSSGFYYDMEYSVDYSSFQTLPVDNSFKTDDVSSPKAIEIVSASVSSSSSEIISSYRSYKTELALLDLFSGCGGMSTGLCLGARLSCVDLVTRWALDNNKFACESLKLNHPETNVRNDAAEDFLELLKEWEKLCKKYAVKDIESMNQSRSMSSRVAAEDGSLSDDDITPGEYEVSRIIDICYGDPNKTGKRGLHFKVHWKGYSASEDTWEPTTSLSNCQECILDFVRNGFKSKILPLPGDADVICGGPPCQGISGYNRFRNVDSPLSDERNRQIAVFMDIVQFLKPKFVLMENVVDILKFDKASFARYALSRLVHMKYQARLGTVAAGCYGLPQFRLRVFLWGAHPSEKLPQFPLPSHDVIVRYYPPSEFERNTVAYDEGQPRELENAVVLQDAISDLPPVTTHETREEMTYEKPPETEFQRFIRSTEYEMTGRSSSTRTNISNLLHDHRPYALTEDDIARVCLIPKRKGANFRDLPGVIVGNDNVVRRDPKKEELLPSGKPLVPDFAFTFEQGKSKRPYARLWWDETVPTVVTYPSIHSQAMLHPEQDRVLTIRECARLQGFPDYYRFCGTVKERYRQVGNAVAVPVGRALGYALGMAFQKLKGGEPLMKLPPKFSHSTNLQLEKSLFPKTDQSL